MNETSSTFTGRHPTHDEISSKAKELWETYGRPAGRDEEIWLEAERALQSPASNAGTVSTRDVTPPPPRAVSGTGARTPAGGATATPRMPGSRSKRAV